MKKALYLFAAALAIFASCDPKEDVKPEEPKLNVAEKSVVLDSAGDSKTIAVEANNAWTAEVTSGQDWLRAEAKANELVISAPAWTTHQPRMGAVTVKSKDLNVVVAVTQLAAPNNDKISVTPTSVNFDAAGESKTVTVTANVEVKAVASESWVTITPPATQSGSMTFTLAAAANTASTARNASVTFSGGEADDVTIQVSQNPANVIEVDNNEISATAEGGDFIVKVTANVEWTATASDSWITVSPEKGQSGDLKISVAANDNTAERTATVAIAKGSTGVVINVKQAGKPGEETLLATWRCDNAEYVESHSPDWSTDGANATSHGTGKGIALPEDGAPTGTQMTWQRNSDNAFPLVYITAAEGHFAVKSVSGNDGFVFTIPGQSLAKGKVISIDVALTLGANAAPKNWVAKFRTSDTGEWVVGECSSAVTAKSGATAHLVCAKQKDYTIASRFKASFTIPEAITNANVQIFVCSADGETLTGAATTSGATVRMIPLYGSDATIEFAGPRITIR